MIRPVPCGPVKRRPYSRISNQVARAFTAKWRSKLSTVVSRRPVVTDSQWHITKAVMLPSCSSAAPKIRSGAAGSTRSASIGTAVAPSSVLLGDLVRRP